MSEPASDSPPAPSPAPRLEALRRSLPSRFKAAGIRLSLSAAILGVALYLILARWFPGFHFLVDGGWRGLQIVAGVELVLGPLLTLLVFNPLKRRALVVFDLSCIAAVQLGALAWGFYAVHSQRPVAVSFYEGAFLSVTAEPLKIEKQPADYANRFSDRRPPLVYVAPPADENEEARLAMQQIVGQLQPGQSVVPHEDPFFWRRLDAHWGDVRAHAVAAGVRAEQEPAFVAALPRFLAARGGQAGDYLYFPYEGREGACTLAFTPGGELVDAVGCRRY